MTPEMKERVLARVNAMIDCCPGPEPCRCDEEREYDDWLDDDGDQDFLFEIARDKRYWDD